MNLAQVARDTLEILDRGGYATPGGRVEIQLHPAVRGTRLYAPTDVVGSRGGRSPVITVENITALVAARRMAGQGSRVMVLNFASATRPGGGFLSGAQAQEESLARSSGLYACIKDSPFYEVHRGLRDPFYTDHVIYSPDVPVFRDDIGSLLDRPYPCSFLTCAAPNKGAISDLYPGRLGQVDGVMRSRIDRILDVAYHEGHRTLILGAFGCGVFRNDPFMVAQIFKDLLAGSGFDRVHFAVLDGPHGWCIEAFQRTFSAP